MGSPKLTAQHGFSMLEVLVTLVIVLVGLLGLAGLITRTQQAEMESYQRVQALVLLQDMVSRLNANRVNAASYQVNNVGTGASPAPTCTGTLTQIQSDLCQWHQALLGAAKQSGASNIGAMIGARGCVFKISGTEELYVVTVAWQGMNETAAPSDGTADNPACGTAANYGTDAKRRVVSTTIRVANLSSI